MSSTELRASNGLIEKVMIESINDQQIEKIEKRGVYRKFVVELQDVKIKNDNKDQGTVTISVLDGLEIYRGGDPANATVLDYDGDVTLSVDGQQTTKTLTNGSVSFDLSTDKPARSEIEIIAESLADHPAESDSATIEVVSA